MPCLVVMPDAGTGTYSRLPVGSEVHDWPRFHTEEIPEFLDATFSVDFAPANQLLAGLSMGGYGAMKYAAWHPDRSGAAAAFSSPLAPLSSMPSFDLIAMREGARSSALFGAPSAEHSSWLGNSPLALAENLRGLDLWFSAGPGRPLGGRDRDLLESHISDQGERFAARLSALGIRHSWFLRTSGRHDWSSWEREFGAWLTTLGRRRSYVSSEPFEPGPGAGAEHLHRRGGDHVADGGQFSYRYDITVSSLRGGNAYQQRADKKGRLRFTGRLAAAMHDPNILGRRTQHFTTLGQEEVTTVRIASAAEDDVSDPAQMKTADTTPVAYIDHGCDSAAADSPSQR